MKVEYTLAGFTRSSEGVFMASVLEAKKMMAELHSNGSLAVLVPVNLDKKGTEICVLVQQQGDTPVMYQSTAPQGGRVGDGGTKQIVFEFEQTAQTNEDGKQQSWLRVLWRDDGCSAALVWRSSTCVHQRALLDERRCRRWPR